MKKETGKKTKISISQQTSLKYVVYFIVFFLLISILCNLFNVRKASDNITYNDRINTHIVNSSVDLHDYTFLDNNWIFVPNVTAEDIINGNFNPRDYKNYEYAENVSISQKSGWNDLGENVTWYNTESVYSPSNNINVASVNSNSGAYIIRILLPENNHDYIFEIPKIAGTADIFCNNEHISKIEPVSFINIFTSPILYDSVVLHPNRVNELFITVVVSADSYVRNPGLIYIPSIIENGYNSKEIILSSLWTSLIFLTLIVGVIGGVIVSTTFSRRSKLYLFIISFILLIIYSLADGDFIRLDPVLWETIRFLVFISLGTMCYSSTASFIEPAAGKKKPKHDILIIAAIGMILILILVFYPAVLKTSYTRIASIIFTMSACFLSIFRVLFNHSNEETSNIAINSAITYLFSFIYMNQDKMTIYNIKAYTIFPIAALLVLEAHFLNRYVKQFFELQTTTSKLNQLVKEKTQHIAEINRDLYNTNKRLIANEDARRNVLSNVSHDLRTPITAIRGYAELLLTARTRMKDEQVETYLQNIMKRSVQMERIVSDIVDLTRMESNESEFKFNDISVAELLDEICMMYDGELRGTNKKLEVDIPDEDMLIIKADYKKLSRVFENLISNSINYTYDDAVIKVKAYRSDADKSLEVQKVHVIVSDNGIGIPENELPMIFDRFYRAKNSGKSIKGTGLGLSIVKTIMDHHKADITVDSKLGEGTTFHMIFKATY